MALAGAADRAARAIMAYAARYVGTACATLINLLNPDEIIIGGPLARWGLPFTELITSVARDATLATPMGAVRILPGDDEEVTVPLGAAASVIKQSALLLDTRPATASRSDGDQVTDARAAASLPPASNERFAPSKRS